MEAVARSDEPRGISELSRELGIDKSAVQRAFETLQKEGYVEQVEDSGRYRSTLKHWELGMRIIARHEARRQIHPILRLGASTTGLTALLAWADFPYVLHLDKVEGESAWPNAGDAGRRIPLWATASGKAVLAYLEGGIDRLEALGPSDKTLPPLPTAASLRAEAQVIRQRMFASSESGATPHVNSVASPFWGPQGIVLGSIGLSGSVDMLPAADLSRIGRVVASLANQATDVLGGKRPHAEI
jgi:DNA-binding IclR family transcriptional regulator